MFPRQTVDNLASARTPDAKPLCKLTFGVLSSREHISHLHDLIGGQFAKVDRFAAGPTAWIGDGDIWQADRSVSPRLAARDLSNNSNTHIVIGANLIRGYSVPVIRPKDFTRMISGELRSAVTLAANAPALVGHIVKVLFSGSGKQMPGIAAWRVVTAVAGVVRIGIDTIVQPVRHAVRSVFHALYPKASISVTGRINAACPRPAFVRPSLVNERPEACGILRGHCGEFTILNRHDVTSETGYFVLEPRAV